MCGHTDFFLQKNNRLDCAGDKALPFPRPKLQEIDQDKNRRGHGEREGTREAADEAADIGDEREEWAAKVLDRLMQVVL